VNEHTLETWIVENLGDNTEMVQLIGHTGKQYKRGVKFCKMVKNDIIRIYCLDNKLTGVVNPLAILM
jgi:hypothetical protein